MTAGKRFIIYFAIAAAACAIVHFVANKSILNLVQQKIYQPAATKKLEERTDSFANTVSQYINQQDSLFTLFSGNSVIRSSCKNDLTDEEIAERSHFSASLLAETPGLKGIRIINANGKQIYYSTFSEDFTTHEVGAIKYTNYPKNTLPYGLIAAQAGEKGKLTPDLEQKRLIFSYPFYDSDLEYRGTIAFYVDAANALRYLIPTDRLGSKTEIVLSNAGNSGLPFGLLFSVPQSIKDLCTDAAIESWEKPGEKIENVTVASEDNSWVIFSKKSENLAFVSMVYPSESLEMPQKSQQYIIWATMFFICFVTFICWAAKTETERKKTRLLEEDVASKKKVEKLAATPMAEALKQQEKMKHSKDFAWNNGEPSENAAKTESAENEEIPDAGQTAETSHGLLNRAEQKNHATEPAPAEKPLKFKQALTPNFDLAKPAETAEANAAAKAESTEKPLNEANANGSKAAEDKKSAALKAKEEKLAQKQQAKEAKIADKLKKKQEKAQEKAKKEVEKLAANEAKKQKKAVMQQKPEKLAKPAAAKNADNFAGNLTKTKPAETAEKTGIVKNQQNIADSAPVKETGKMEETANINTAATSMPAEEEAVFVQNSATAEITDSAPVNSTAAQTAPAASPITGNIFEYSDSYSEEEGFTEIADYVLDDDELEVYANLEEPLIEKPAEESENARPAENAESTPAFSIEENKEAETVEKTDDDEKIAEPAPAQPQPAELKIDDDFADIKLADIDFDAITDDFEDAPIVKEIAEPEKGAKVDTQAAGTQTQIVERNTEQEEKSVKIAPAAVLQAEPAKQTAPAEKPEQTAGTKRPAETDTPKVSKPIQPAKSHLASLFKERMEQNSAEPGTSALQSNAAEEPLKNALFTLDLSKNSEKNNKFDNKSLSFASKNDEHLIRAKQQSMAAAGKQKGDLSVQVTEAVMDRIEVQDEDYIEELEPLAEGEVYTSIFTVGSGMPLFQFGTSQRERTGRSNYAEAFEQASRTLKMAAYNEAVPDTIKESNGIFMINGIDETMPVKINYDFKRLVDSVLNV